MTTRQKSKIKGIVSYILINGIYLTSGYFGFFQNITWCGNIFIFMTSVTFVLLLILFMIGFVLVKVNRDKELSQASLEFAEKQKDIFMMPRFVDIIFDVSVTAGLVYIGQVPLAILVFFSMLFLTSFKSSVIYVTKRIRIVNQTYNFLNNTENNFGHSDEDIDGDGEGDDTLRRMGVL